MHVRRLCLLMACFSLLMQLQAQIDTIKNNYGFINFDAGDDGKKLFFHMSEYKVGDPSELKPGDWVEFAVVRNQRTSKYSACSLTKCPS